MRDLQAGFQVCRQRLAPCSLEGQTEDAGVEIRVVRGLKDSGVGYPWQGAVVAFRSLSMTSICSLGSSYKYPCSIWQGHGQALRECSGRVRAGFQVQTSMCWVFSSTLRAPCQSPASYTEPLRPAAHRQPPPCHSANGRKWTHRVLLALSDSASDTPDSGVHLAASLFP